MVIPQAIIRSLQGGGYIILPLSSLAVYNTTAYLKSSIRPKALTYQPILCKYLVVEGLRISGVGYYYVVVLSSLKPSRVKR